MDQVQFEKFRRGLQALTRGDFRAALGLFEAVIRAPEADGGAGGVPPRCLSYYGLALALATGRLAEARRFCEHAVRAEFYNPEVYLNLGRVYLQGGDRSRAYGAFMRGLQLNPRDTLLAGHVRRMGIRRQPILGFLPRGHVLNRWLGRLRADASRPA